MYMVVFIGSASLHAVYIRLLFNSPELLRKLMIPFLDPTTISIPQGVAAFVKWDRAGSTILIISWFAGSLTDLVLPILRHVLATFAVGAGAAIAGTML